MTGPDSRQSAAHPLSVWARQDAVADLLYGYREGEVMDSPTSLTVAEEDLEEAGVSEVDLYAWYWLHRDLAAIRQMRHRLFMVLAGFHLDLRPHDLPVRDALAWAMLHAASGDLDHAVSGTRVWLDTATNPAEDPDLLGPVADRWRFLAAGLALPEAVRLARAGTLPDRASLNTLTALRRPTLPLGWDTW